MILARFRRRQYTPKDRFGSSEMHCHGSTDSELAPMRVVLIPLQFYWYCRMKAKARKIREKAKKKDLARC